MLLKKDDDFNVADLKEMFNDKEDMEVAMEKAKQTSLKQAKTNAPYRDRILTLVQEAESRGFLD